MGRIIHNPGTAKVVAALCVSLVAFAGWLHLFEHVIFKESVKTVFLQHRNESLRCREEIQEHRMDDCADILNVLHSRDNDVYRSIFGMDALPSLPADSLKGLERVALMERFFKAQTLSYNQIDSVLKNAGTMAASIPAICPVIPEEGSFRVSSGYGFREHPITHQTSFHGGVDFSLHNGNPVFVTGDGKVESVRIELHGYGRQLIVDHGFGYKTRYAHLKDVLVTEGMKLHRGDQVATSGNTGLSTGSHLHYEVIYRGEPVNPKNYYDPYIPLDQYMKMVTPSVGVKTDFYIHPRHRK